VFIRPDEPIEARRKQTLERLKDRAERSGKHVSVVNGMLAVDGVDVFSLENGHVRRQDG